MWSRCRLILMVAIVTLLIATPSAAAPITPTNPFPIAEVSGNAEYARAIAHDPGRSQYLVVNENAGALNARCLGTYGQQIAVYVLGNINGEGADAVYDPSRDLYLVVWGNSGNIYGNYVSGDCCQQLGCNGAPFTVSGDRPGYEANPAIAYNNNTNHEYAVVVWTDDGNTSSHWAVYGRRLDGTTPVGNSFAIKDDATAFHYDPDIAYNLNHNEFLVVFTRDTAKGMNFSALNVHGRRIYNNPVIGLLDEETIDASGEAQDQPSVAAYRLNTTTPYIVVFRDHWNDTAGDVRGYTLFVDGQPESLLNISTEPNIPESGVHIASSEAAGGYAVTWVRSSGAQDDLHWRKITPGGVLGPQLDVYAGPGNHREPAIVNDPPVPLVIWTQSISGEYDVYGRFLFTRIYIPLVLRAGN